MSKMTSLILLSVPLAVVLAGCSDPVEPEDPLVRITIDPRPASLDASWRITGPGAFEREGNGLTTLRDLEAGDYVLTWGDVAGWTTPDQAAETLPLGGSADLVGQYQAAVGSADGFVAIDPGSFDMGSPVDEPGRSDWEALHEVTLTRGFLISRFEVTRAWWDEVVGTGASQSALPVSGLSWDLAVAFCNALSLREGLTPAYHINAAGGDVTWDRDADGYRLPTEAEWEYACRAGSTTAFANGPLTEPYCAPLDANLAAIGWYCGNSGYILQEIGNKAPNALGLYDMHGSVAEWVWDGYRADYENLDPVDPVQEAGPGEYRVLRGGAWFYRAASCRSASRRSEVPDKRLTGAGLRPVRTLF